MKPRQIKKNSKSAMNLLIKVCPKYYNKQRFYREEQPTNKNNRYNRVDYFYFFCSGEPDYESGDCDGQPALVELFDAMQWAKTKFKSAKYADWITDDFEIKDYFMKISDINLIKECRKLAKAGVILRLTIKIKYQANSYKRLFRSHEKAS